MVESTVTADSKLTSSDTRRRIWAIVGASSGNLVEWFDFYVYCSVHSLLCPHLLPFREHDDSTTATAGVFCCGFSDAPDRRLAIWPHGADKTWSQKSIKLLSVCMMCFGSLVIACLPCHETPVNWLRHYCFLLVYSVDYPLRRIWHQRP